jgi:multidrug efflux system membrane fusion protein
MKKSIFIVAFVVFGFSLAACGQGAGVEAKAKAAQPAATKSKVRSVAVVPLASEKFVSFIVASGTALPVQEGYLSMAVPGRIKEILVKRGERVKKGQALVRLDRSGFYLGVQQAEAGLAAAKVGVGALTAEMTRFDRLLSKKAIPRATYDKVKAQYDGAAAQVAMAEVGMKMARKALTDSELKAPYDGVISMVLKSVGEYAPAMPPTMLVQIVDTSSVEVQVFLPEEVARNVSVGKRAQVTIDSAGIAREGEIIFVSDRVQPGTQTFEVRIGLSNEDGAIKTGAFSRVRMVRRDDEQALLVPLRSVRRDEKGNPFVFVEKSSKAVKTLIRLGETREDRVLVLEGLSKGSRLITSGVSNLSDGQVVAPKAG